MRRQLIIVTLLAMVAFWSASMRAAQQRPLTASDLLKLLAGGVYSSRVAMLVHERGITFLPTKRYLRLFARAGADRALQRTVISARRVTPRAEPGPGDFRGRPPISQQAGSEHTDTSLHQVFNFRSNTASSRDLGMRAASQSNIPSANEPTPRTEAQASFDPRSHADDVQNIMQAWLARTSNQQLIPVGTTITTQNWQRYSKFMPVGMIGLFEGRYFWKMPADVQMNIGPTVIHPLSRSYIEASERYDNQVRVIHLPDGRMKIDNYVAGMPFPIPQEPDKGYKILANLWFPDQPYLQVVAPETGLASFCTMDRFGNQACTRMAAIYRQLAFNNNPLVPRIEPQAGGAWYTEWLMVEQPINTLQIGTGQERSRYTVDLTIFWQDMTRAEDNYVYIPSLRRSMRFSGSARCAPVFGSDILHDDQRGGYNGGISTFNAEYYGERKILALTDLTDADGMWPAEFDQPLGWAKPSWGAWSLRDAYVIDVRRIPTQRPGYCYGSRVMYVDAQFMHQLWEEIYDADLRLWKVVSIHLHPAEINPAEGVVPLDGSSIETYWDIRNGHLTHLFTASRDGRSDTMRYNQKVPKEYDNITKYSTPGGLMQIMR